MAVLINFKICDNDKACSGMSICPNNVFTWNENKKTIEINNDLCINCGLCENACMVSAIRVAKDDDEYNKIQKEIDDDPRNINDLFVDRYGASPVDPAMIGKEAEIEDKMQSKRPLVLEIYNEDSIQCLLKSIPIKEILKEFDIESAFRKIKVDTNRLLDIYNIKELPALVFIKDNAVLGTIEGYYTEEDLKEFFTKIHNIKEKK